MPFSNGYYYGNAGGAVQTAYTDQPGVGVPGMLAFASDIELCDAYYVGDSNGVTAGSGVVLSASGDTFTTSLQSPDLAAFNPTSSANLAAFGGIIVFDETMMTDGNGNPGWVFGRMCQVLRYNRVGGRIYVRAREAVTAFSSTVNWVIVGGDINGVTYYAGEFAPESGAGTAGAVDTTSLKAAGSGYSIGTALATTDSPANGTGCTINITAVTSGGGIAAYTVAANGTGYQAADVLTVTQSGGSGGQINVLGVVAQDKTVAITNAQYVTSAPAGGVAIVEFLN
jgi:hypothetical protein